MESTRITLSRTHNSMRIINLAIVNTVF